MNGLDHRFGHQRVHIQKSRPGTTETGEITAMRRVDSKALIVAEDIAPCCFSMLRLWQMP